MHSVPGNHVFHIAKLLEHWNVGSATFFEGMEVNEAELEDPNSRISVVLLETLIKRAIALTGEPALGPYFGFHMHLSAHGYLGFATLCASTLREALELTTKFAPMLTTALELRVEEEGGVAAVIIEERADFGSVRDTVLLALMTGLWQMGKSITQDACDVTELELACPEPEYAARLGRAYPLLEGRVRWGERHNRLIFPAEKLNWALVSADPAGERLAREQCERALHALQADAAIVARVRRLIAEPAAGFRSLDEVAVAMHTSTRTLKRKLAAQRLTFSALLEEQRCERATLLLRSSDRTLEEVANRVGYSDVPNFARAFRRWTGTSPASYRQRRVAPPSAPRELERAE